MNLPEFSAGMKIIETGLQGVIDECDAAGKVVKQGTSFKPEFLEYLFKQIPAKLPQEVWLKICERISRRPCKPRDLTVADFFGEINSFREAQAWERARWKVAPYPEHLDLASSYQHVLEDPKAPESMKAFARSRLESMKTTPAPGPGERKPRRPQGGEKYRRMKKA